jgi:Flp pilus assembly protein TadG
MKTISTSPIWLRARRCAVNMLGDSSGIAATEFAVIVPLMLAMFFGTVEFSSGVAVDRKVTTPSCKTSSRQARRSCRHIR